MNIKLNLKMKEKTTDLMNFEEFVKWATQMVIDAVITGGFKNVYSAIFLIVGQVQGNKVFGGNSKKK